MTNSVTPFPIDLSIIIVNYNTAELLQGCLESMQTQTGASFEIFVVDNASHDDSVARVKKHFPAVNLLASPTNLGFAKANNLALRQATGRFIYFLNPDTEVTPGCFSAMLTYMDAHPAVGMAGTRVIFPDGRPQSSVEYSYPGDRYARQETTGLPGTIAWLLGASLIARPEVLARTGGFDERFFLYGEDVDLGFMVRKLGWELGFIAEACIVHWEGQSERRSLPIQVLRKKLAAELLFYQKHYTVRSITRIKRINRLKANWRLLTLRLALPFVRDREKQRQQIGRYQTIREMLS